jgi:2'-5' RNA ligase
VTGAHDTPSFDRMRDHWWWRPGWRVGRTFYTWHLTFDHAPDVHRLAADYEAVLDIPGLDVVPPRWLHLTMQGVGFTDEVSTADVDAIAEAARRRLAELEPFELTLGPTVPDPEVVRLEVAPGDPVANVRDAIRAGIADVWGAHRVPETGAGFIPHVSLAYSSATGPAEPILRAAESAQVEPATATITEAQMIVLNRDQREYQWTTYSVAPLGQAR